MERDKMIETLMKKAHVGHDEAIEILEKCNWDMLDAIIYLERCGKVPNDDTTTIVEVEEVKDEKSHSSKKEEKKSKEQKEYGGIGEVVGRMFRFLGTVISKANRNYFEAKKDHEKPIRISLLILILFLLFLFPATVVILVIGLFCGYKYSIDGESLKCDGVNDVFEKASESADSIKNDFKKGYNEN